METEKAIENIKRAMNEHLAVEECTICFTNDLAIILEELEKKDKMIELLIEDLQGEGCLNMTREEIDNYYERRIKLAEGVE